MDTPPKIPFSWVVVSAKLMGDSTENSPRYFHMRWRALAHELLLVMYGPAADVKEKSFG